MNIYHVHMLVLASQHHALHYMLLANSNHIRLLIHWPNKQDLAASNWARVPFAMRSYIAPCARKKGLFACFQHDVCVCAAQTFCFNVGTVGTVVGTAIFSVGTVGTGLMGL